jgi:hypothetical protein
MNQGSIPGKGKRFFSIASRLALEPTQPPSCPMGTGHSPPSTAEVVNACNYTSGCTIHLPGMVLKHRDKFIFTVT